MNEEGTCDAIIYKNRMHFTWLMVSSSFLVGGVLIINSVRSHSCDSIFRAGRTALA